MKRVVFLMLTCSLIFLIVIVCQWSTNRNKISRTSERLIVTVTTSFLYDMVEQLAGNKVQRELVIPAGEDPHIYTAKSSDLQKLKGADLVLYHGLHFEGKMIDALEQTGVAVTKKFQKSQLNMMNQDGEEIVDPHFWFDISLYKSAVKVVSTELQRILPGGAASIKRNTKDYLTKLDELDIWIRKELDAIPKDSRYLVTPHDAFKYFAASYGFTLYAPQGISTNSEVSNSDMIETVNLIVKHGIKSIFTESTTNPERMEKLQEAVSARGSSVEVIAGEDRELFSDSLAPKGKNGDTYIDMYKHNVSLIVNYLK